MSVLKSVITLGKAEGEATIKSTANSGKVGSYAIEIYTITWIRWWKLFQHAA